MTWVYDSRLYDTKFQASCRMARLEDAALASSIPCRLISIFQTSSGRYGVKMLVVHDSSESERRSK
ncbi:two-component system, OmpR family, sensor histidine kinase ResE [Alicyclobacillus vulcanalis]|uniref:Two-component system, OmpR family, sensor histidine kinase ResE n=1 Tax=Alicyclobacillus vulcanalis TaxID=252246 RepID=A0A1N7KKH2_9BACL|nr:two-component system, OmpR family, sensor histidine kinase ResE [Alicyclobacillus vulcanalis]